MKVVSIIKRVELSRIDELMLNFSCRNHNNF